MRKYIFILFLLLFSSIAFAEPTLFYKQGESIDLKIPCANDGLPCSSVSTCNITINYPDGSNMVNNKLMTNNGTYHNYTLPSSSVVGEYQTTVFCIDGADAGYKSFSIYVLNDNVNFGDTNILDYKVFLLFTLLGFILFTIYQTIRKNIVLGYTSATIIMLSGAYSWFYGLSMTISLGIQAYEVFNPILTKAVGTVLVLFSLWLYLDSSFNKKEKSNDTEFREEY